MPGVNISFDLTVLSVESFFAGSASSTVICFTASSLAFPLYTLIAKSYLPAFASAGISKLIYWSISLPSSKSLVSCISFEILKAKISSLIFTSRSSFSPAFNIVTATSRGFPAFTTSFDNSTLSNTKLCSCLSIPISAVAVYVVGSAAFCHWPSTSTLIV